MRPQSASTRNIRNEIVDRRRERIALEGYGLGVAVPQTRQVPTVPFNRQALVISEIKRRSPSRGDIAPGLDPVAQARLYQEGGIQSVSVLTEEDYFGGSLSDLMAVKAAFPGLAVLRKDFLVDEHDVLISWQAGADAILLIASMLSAETLFAMHRQAEHLGMAALVEVHTAAEIEKIRPLKPALVGINCRNLEDFRIDRLMPLGLRPLIDWNAEVIFESGIFSHEDALYTHLNGFQGILVGEAVVRKPQLIPDLIRGVQGIREAAGAPAGLWPQTGFWQTMANLLFRRESGGSTRPLVKVCGIVRPEDGEAAVQLGADMLGFVFAPSPRRASVESVRSLAHLAVPKVAVVVGVVPPEVQALLAEGILDAVQYSGDELPLDCANKPWAWYKALRVSGLDGLEAMDHWRSPRILLDAWSADAFGGTGKRLDPAVVRAASARTALWIAGGISPANIENVVREMQPELVDLSSSLESEPGKKDPAKLQAFFAGLAAAQLNY